MGLVCCGIGSLFGFGIGLCDKVSALKLVEFLSNSGLLLKRWLVILQGLSIASIELKSICSGWHLAIILVWSLLLVATLSANSTYCNLIAVKWIQFWVAWRNYSMFSKYRRRSWGHTTVIVLLRCFLTYWTRHVLFTINSGFFECVSLGCILIRIVWVCVQSIAVFLLLF